MAILNGMYIHVVDEEVSKEVETTSHPVESGIEITDTVRKKPFILSISGKLVDYGDMQSHQVLAKIKSLMDSGSLISYRGRNVCSDMQIQAFASSHPNTIHGGADFSMELKQVRIAKSAYVPKPAASTEKKEEEKKNPAQSEIVKGSTVVFKGGSVYVSSDAKVAAATRSRSTCTVYNISKASWSIHQYCLISTDGGGVYGWVDFKNIEGAEQTSTSATTNAGTQQVKSGGGTAVYHTTKSGDTIYNLVTKSYKDVNTSVDWVIQNNPNAFSVKGDATTLKVGVKILIGYR